MAIDIGRINYQKYYDVLIERTQVSLPKWEELDQPHQDAWRHAAVAVLQYIREEQERMEKDPELEG